MWSQPGPEPSRCRLELDAYALEVDPEDGGRIVEFSLDGDNVLVSRDESPLAYGSSFWPSPQSDWDWPPPPELDRLPWSASVVGSTLVLESRTNERLALAASVRIMGEPATGAVRSDFSLKNQGSAPRRVAPWQNTRVRPGGLTFYPSRGPVLPGSTLELPLVNGVAWLRHDPATMTANAKSFADGAEGWLAHVERDLLFVKVFDEVPRAEQAPGESSIELYVDKTGKFVEVEQQGHYLELLPGAATTWTVRWLLRRLPSSLVVSVGSPALVEAARALAREALRSARGANLTL